MNFDSVPGPVIFGKPVNPVYIMLGLIIAFVLIIRLQFLHIPFERDEGTYCYMGTLVLNGKIPYKDFHEMKPPVLYYSYAVLLFLFGKTVEAMHIGFAVLNMFTIIFLYFIGKNLLQGKTAGLIASASYAVLSLTPVITGYGVQAEHIISFYLTAGLLLLLLGIEKNRLPYFFLSGVFFCLAFLVKQNGMFFVAFAAIITVIYPLLQKPVVWKQMRQRIIVYSAGVLSVITIIVAVLYFQGALQECLYWIVSFSAGYVSTFSLQEGVSRLIDIGKAIIRNNKWMWLVAGAGFVLPVIFSKAIPLFTRIFIWLFAILSLLAVTPGLRFFGHYFIFFMPAVALLAAVCIVSVRNILTKYFPKNVSSSIALCIFFAALFYNLYMQREYYFNHNDKAVLRAVYGMCPFPETMVIGDYIKQNSTEKDFVLVFGSESEIYFYTGRKCPTVHCDDELLNLKSDRAHIFQEEYKRDIQASPPRYIVTDGSHVERMQYADSTSYFSWMNKFIIQNYTVAGKADMLTYEHTEYLWGNAARQYKVQSPHSVYVYERKAKQSAVAAN